MANKYQCKNCNFEWSSPEKEYTECPDCQSKNIQKIDSEEIQRTIEQPGMERRKGYGRGVTGAGPPRVCKCTHCGHEAPKTHGIPCRNSKCPECGAKLCGAD